MSVCRLILRKYPWIIMAPIVLGIVLGAIRIAHSIYQASHYTPPSISFTKEEKGRIQKAPASLDHYAIIINRDLFAPGTAGVEKGVKGVRTTPSASTAPFKLRGTVVVKSGTSCAIIEDPTTRKQQVFHQDEVVGGFKIIQIMRNKVIVSKDGRQEVVEVIEEKREPPKRPAPTPRRIKRRPVRRPVKRVPQSGEIPQS